MRNVMPKFQSCRLDGVATIERTPIHAYIHTGTKPHPAELGYYLKSVIRGD